MENPFELIFEKLTLIEAQLTALNNSIHCRKVSETSKNDLMNIRQVATYLSLAVPTIYGFTHRMEIPHMKRSKRLYFRKDEIDEWLLKSRRSTMDEIRLDAENYLTRRRKID